jgi:hypothetical protein
MWLLVLMAALYSGFVFYRRWHENRSIADQAQEREAAAARKVVDQYGGGSMKILQFYATGAQLCYGVANAKSVRIDPFVGEIVPSLARCVDVKAKPGTVYTFKAVDATGKEESRSTTAP